MLRVQRIEKVYVNDDLKLDLQRGLDTLRRHYPPSIVNLYAVPQLASKRLAAPNLYAHLDWLSPTSGQLYHYDALTAKEQTILREKTRQKQNAVQALQEELLRRGCTEDAAHLQSLLLKPDNHQLYQVNGEPLIVQWKIIPLSPDTAFTHNYAQMAHQVPTPDFTIILDTSYSMKLNISATTEDEAWFMDIQHTDQELSPKGKRILKSPSRLQVAQQAIINMLPLLHANVNVRLISFLSCEQVLDHGVFSQAQHPELINIILALEPSGPTPLVRSLYYAANAVDGVNKDALTLCFVDGEDGCGLSIEEAANQINLQKPRMRINVIDISGLGLSNVLAHKTGGRVYCSKKAREISKMIIQSTNEIAAKPKKNI